MKPIPWHKRVLEQRTSWGLVEKPCVICERTMYLPRSKAPLWQMCSPECRQKHSDNLKVARTRNCATCGEAFLVRPCHERKGIGKFCSHRCSGLSRADETGKRLAVHTRENHRLGRIRYRRGADHHNWKGGREAFLARQVWGPEQRDRQRAYWQANPEKVKEWRHNRRGRKYGRLPTGTIKRIGTLQRWRCAICRCPIAAAYHQDHIQPLSKGGLHEPRNIQLLCQSCNCKKHARDPMDYMRSLGRLL